MSSQWLTSPLHATVAMPGRPSEPRIPGHLRPALRTKSLPADRPRKWTAAPATRLKLLRCPSRESRRRRPLKANRRRETALPDRPTRSQLAPGAGRLRKMSVQCQSRGSPVTQDQLPARRASPRTAHEVDSCLRGSAQTPPPLSLQSRRRRPLKANRRRETAFPDRPTRSRLAPGAGRPCRDMRQCRSRRSPAT